ncbi:MAG: N-acetylmuramoyl-L-alanine amidase [Muricauda sp.]|jgi:N-acetylmuramoyl-L-alanine amidase|nr:N-acetylmuramoyl-L-alanine amidase [Allomuricauda sp.]MAU27144.1 N-acetylmuramoyl-L-alanine amidase [Allomuricauda sp.]MBC30669.1 N-acetylmuramoyl-L-alanine amidase [Allomuricauda sp.]|tara:strand:+ start:1103 stop:2125 length:1023 start_codon:yes stop_codon:yes gene_type:complete
MKPCPLKYFLFIFWLPCFMVAQDTLATVVAKQGDGIYSLLRRHGVNPTKFYNNFVELNAERLGEDESLYMGRAYLLPDTLALKEAEENDTGIRYPLFGNAFAKVDSVSNRLDDTVYYLISGHGGPDPGAVEKYNGTLIAEDEYAYDVTLRLARELLSHGAEVHIIVQDGNDGIRDDRALELDTDEFVIPDKAIPLKQLARLKQRTEAVNRLYLKNRGKYQRLLVTHVDSRSRGTDIDVFFYHHEKSKSGKRLAESIHQTFLRKYKKFQPNRTYHGTFMERSGLYVVKNTLPAMAYIEIGNIRSKKDQRRILDPDNRQALAKWISEGIMLDYESSKTVSSK